MSIRYTFLFCMLFTACTQPSASQDKSVTNPLEKTIQTRFNVPDEYTRVQVDEFGAYLRQLPLQPAGAVLHLYNSEPKHRQDVHAAIVKMDVGQRDLQQCADAVMRLRAEYLYERGRYSDIHFNFTNGFRADYSKWRQGFRIRVNGNNVEWVKQGVEDKSYTSFRKYLNIVLSYAGTLSLSKELKPVLMNKIKPGDVLIHGGSPGHAVIVTDVAVNAKGNKVFMLAQSYMPAQEIHVLKNPANPDTSPWYSLEAIQLEIITPEWTFTINELKRFE